MDGGQTWSHLGLERTERIHRILVHPSDPNIAYAAAMGQMWGENPDRGVFKTTDGGKTWKKALYVDERTGCAELVMDPSNPNKLIAGMWEYRRWPWFFKSGGPGSGLYITHDAGKHGNELARMRACRKETWGELESRLPNQIRMLSMHWWKRSTTDCIVLKMVDDHGKLSTRHAMSTSALFILLISE
jgi:hypothetical protein